MGVGSLELKLVGVLLCVFCGLVILGFAIGESKASLELRSIVAVLMVCVRDLRFAFFGQLLLIVLSIIIIFAFSTVCGGCCGGC